MTIVVFLEVATYKRLNEKQYICCLHLGCKWLEELSAGRNVKQPSKDRQTIQTDVFMAIHVLYLPDPDVYSDYDYSYTL